MQNFSPEMSEIGYIFSFALPVNRRLNFLPVFTGKNSQPYLSVRLRGSYCANLQLIHDESKYVDPLLSMREA